MIKFFFIFNFCLIFYICYAKSAKWEFSIPGYNYCGPGTPFLERLKNYRKYAPINKLDLACFYHDLIYSDCTANEEIIRWADEELVRKAKEFNEEIGIAYKNLSWFKKFRLHSQAKFVKSSINLKIELEDNGMMDKMNFVETNPEITMKIREFLIFETKLPEAWKLEFYYENQIPYETLI